MNIQGPKFDPSMRIEAIGQESQDEAHDQRKRKRSFYQGRSWSESDEDLPVEPPRPEPPKRAPSGIYSNHHLLEAASALFAELTTLEEKVAQLCFFQTIANYDPFKQKQLERIIQNCQIGGVVFSSGSFERQAYLIERFQALSKTALLVGNDLVHGLSFYFQPEPIPDFADKSEQHCLDLGKAVMAQNRRLGVHFQFNWDKFAASKKITEAQAKAFSKGIRQAKGLIGRTTLRESFVSPVGGMSSDQKGVAPKFSEYQVEQTIGLKTLCFYQPQSGTYSLVEAFEQGYDAFLFSEKIEEGIASLVQAVRSGKIKEELLDRHVMKVLILKSLFSAP